jgi:hypothetical protein
MTKIICVTVFSFLLSISSFAQRNCGQQIYLEQLQITHPETKSQIIEQRKQAQLAAEQYKESLKMASTMKTTGTTVTIPVVFHIVLDNTQIASIGGTAGIEDRINTQLISLNKDYNGLNADKSKIPAAWASLYANVGIQFGLAVKKPDGTSTPGYDIRYATTPSTFTDVGSGCSSAKTYASGGLDPWDNTKYLNIWVVNMKYGSSTVLGVTAPPGSSFPSAEKGIALYYLAFGTRTSASEAFEYNIDQGRTLTHEMGHYFYLWHTWGDDGGLCPSDPGGDDDGIADTPPEADAKYHSPTYPLYDACSTTSPGVMFMNYMEYTDDTAMYMFTKDQSAVINGQIALLSNSYSLTQHPELAKVPTYIPTIGLSEQINIYPNPTTGVLSIKFNSDSNVLTDINIINLLGQRVLNISNPQSNIIDLSSLSKGIYMVQCQFNTGTITKKIVIQ